VRWLLENELVEEVTLLTYPVVRPDRRTDLIGCGTGSAACTDSTRSLCSEKPRTSTFATIATSESP
jgi:hypothetical protein